MIGFDATKLARLPALADGKPAPGDAEHEVPELPEDIVLPSGGSGSALIACERAGRQARLVELDPRYCDVIIRRWRDWAGDTATLEANGRSYEESAAGREATAA